MEHKTKTKKQNSYMEEKKKRMQREETFPRPPKINILREFSDYNKTISNNRMLLKRICQNFKRELLGFKNMISAIKNSRKVGI